jgi:uncharacterized membrane protein YfcA
MTYAIALVIFLGGLAAGFLTGLLGVGGGVVMVPVMYQVFLYLHEPSKVAFTTAVATSLAVMIFSGSAAALNYHRQKLLNWRLMLWAAIGTLLGASLGAHVMIASNDQLVRIAFGLFLWLVAASMFLPKAQPRPQDHRGSPGYNLGLLVVGMIMGGISALFGVGGGALLVPALVVFFGIAIHTAVATSTGIIVFTALFGTVSYLLIGWGDPQTPAGGLGWIHPFAFLLLLPGAVLATRYGVRAATALSRERLRTVMVLFQLAIGARFIFF